MERNGYLGNGPAELRKSFSFEEFLHTIRRAIHLKCKKLRVRRSRSYKKYTF
jgi:hypothetical protein